MAMIKSPVGSGIGGIGGIRTPGLPANPVKPTIINADPLGIKGDTGGSSGATASAPATPEWSGYSGGDNSGQDDVLNMIKDLLNQQKVAADNMYKSQYEQALADNRLAMENNRNQINLNYARGDRYLKGLYGDALSGQGLSNRVRNNAVWQSNLANNRVNYEKSNKTAKAQYDAGIANNASTLAQGWYNYVLPIYTNRQQNEDDYAYRRYVASLL